MKRYAIAVGIAILISLVGVTINDALGATNIQCASASNTHKWGFWPGAQYVTDHTYWCWGRKWLTKTTYVMVITSRTSTVTAHGNDVGGLCEKTGTKTWLVASGTNYREWEDEGDFKCATNIPGVYVYRSDKMIIWADAEGHYCGPDYCPCNQNNTCSK